MDKTTLDGLLSLNELRLTEEETESVLGAFDFMAGKEKIMDGIDTENVEVMVHVMPMNNVLREDVREQPFTRESLLEGAPEHTEDSWQVPRLVK
ncbi:MAG: Asp-tRNA(Asn)/Glu-tRNA(Gln) amidotransferase subunit GatC [Clostridiales bacterium]|nr:Asp-tRNA(Asn)/Glu-tRNA(Gln) amidotransferase subunit GatC [Clostridiales bacterium]